MNHYTAVFGNAAVGDIARTEPINHPIAKVR